MPPSPERLAIAVRGRPDPRGRSRTLPSGGRPARALTLNSEAGLVLAAEIGESHTRVAVTDLEPRILAERVGKVDVASGPIPIAGWICDRWHELLREPCVVGHPVLGIGISLPAPVDFDAGRVVGPSIITGWDDFDISRLVQATVDVPLFVDNDVNLMTLAELRRDWPDVEQLLFIKAGTGIGSGIIIDGQHLSRRAGCRRRYRPHPAHAAAPPLCRCGKLGCVEARAGGWALARDRREEGFEARNARDIIALVRRPHPEAIRLVRDAGRVLGEVTADVVSMLNPSVIVVGGTLARADEHLLSGVRELVSSARSRSRRASYRSSPAGSTSRPACWAPRSW